MTFDSSYTFSSVFFCFLSSFMLKLRVAEQMLSHESLITTSCLSSSRGCGVSCILIIFSMQWGRLLASLWPAFISFIESPTTTRLVTDSFFNLSCSKSCMKHTIFHWVGGVAVPSALADTTATYSFRSSAVSGRRVCEE